MNPGLSLTPAKAGVRAGLLCRCPDCGKGPLFTSFLKVVDRCAACGFDFTRLNTGDGAAIFIMQIAGAIVVFGALFIQVAWNPPIWALLVIALQIRNLHSSPNEGGGPPPGIAEGDPEDRLRGGGAQPLGPAPAVGPLHHPSAGEE